MINEDFLQELVVEIMSKGYDRETARRFAVLIGDTPTVDTDGNVLVMDGKAIVAKLKLDRYRRE